MDVEPARTTVEKDQKETDKKFIVESSAIEDLSTEDSEIDKILQDAENSRLEAERILNADS